MATISFNGMTMEFVLVEFMMDAQLKLEVATRLGRYSEQSLLDAYLRAHKEKFGSEFMSV